MMKSQCFRKNRNKLSVKNREEKGREENRTGGHSITSKKKKGEKKRENRKGTTDEENEEGEWGERKVFKKEKRWKALGGECDNCLFGFSGRKFPSPPFFCLLSVPSLDPVSEFVCTNY